jgi:hypothetical protein
MNPQDTQYPATTTNPSATEDLTNRVRADGSAVTEAAKSDLTDIAEQAKSDVKALSDEAGEQVSAATEKVKSFAGDQKDLLAGQINGLSAAISKVAGELDQSDQSTIARYARDLAGGLSNLGKDVESNDVDQLIGKAQTFGQRQPLAFLGAAALAGFVTSRFAVASAQRSGNQTAPKPQGGGATSYRAETSSAYSEGDR